MTSLIILKKMGFQTTPLIGFIRGIVTVINIIKKEHIHLLISHDYKSNICAIIASKICKIPVITVFHGRTSHNKKILLFELLDDKLLYFFNSIICVSKSTQRKLAHKGIPIKKLKVIENAINIKKCSEIPITTFLYEELNIPKSSKIIVNIGRVSPEKGQYYFIKAAINIVSKMPDYYFIIVGDGPNLKALKAMVIRAGHSRRIIFLGFRNDAISILKQSDLIVLTSITEGMPIVVLEAFALKIPVLSSPVGGIPEIVIEGHTGYLCSPENTYKLTEKIISIVNSNQQESITAAAFKLAKDNLSFEKQSAKLSQLYTETINKYCEL